MCFPKNFTVLRTSILQNVDRLTLLKHLKMKIAGPDKFLVLMKKFGGEKT